MKIVKTNVTTKTDEDASLEFCELDSDVITAYLNENVIFSMTKKDLKIICKEILELIDEYEFQNV